MRQYTFENIPLTVISKSEIIEYFRAVAESENLRVISFINPEIVLTAQKDKDLRDYFVAADKNFIDGINLLYAMNKICGANYGVDDRRTGTDFFTYLPSDKNFRVFFYGAKKENCEAAKTKIEAEFQNVKIAGFVDGYTKISDDEIVAKINEANADIVIVCLGCPRQELWIGKNCERIKAKVIFGNGGAIDFWSGKTRRAPKFMINAGLEWLYRFFESFSFSRLKRQARLSIFLLKYKLKLYKILPGKNDALYKKIMSECVCRNGANLDILDETFEIGKMKIKKDDAEFLDSLQDKYGDDFAFKISERQRENLQNSEKIFNRLCVLAMKMDIEETFRIIFEDVFCADDENSAASCSLKNCAERLKTWRIDISHFETFQKIRELFEVAACASDGYVVSDELSSINKHYKKGVALEISKGDVACFDEAKAKFKNDLFEKVKEAIKM